MLHFRGLNYLRRRDGEDRKFMDLLPRYWRIAGEKQVFYDLAKQRSAFKWAYASFSAFGLSRHHLCKAFHEPQSGLESFVSRP